MSFQTFESIPQPITDQKQAPARNGTAELPGLIALSEVQQNKYEPATDENKSKSPEHVAPAATLDGVLTSIQRDYRNGLFYSLRDQIPFYYPPLPEVLITDGKTDRAPEEVHPKK